MKGSKQIVFGAALALLLLSSGCIRLWQNSVDIKTYLLTADRNVPAVEKAMAEQLIVDTVVVLPPFNSRNLIVQKSDTEFEPTYYTELLITPPENVRNILFSWFSESGIFEEVVLADRRKKSYRMVATVISMGVDARAGDALKTEISMKVSLINERSPGATVLMSKTYSRTESIDSLEAGLAIKAWGLSMQSILADCESDLISVMQRARP